MPKMVGLVWVKSQFERVPQRYWLCLLAGFNIFILNMVKNIEFRVFDRITLANGLPAHPYVPGSYSCPYRGLKKKLNFFRYAQFIWDPYVKSRVQNACQWAHIMLHLPFGIWADLYGGGHRMIFWSLVASSVITLATPAAVEADTNGVFYFGMFLLRRLTAGPVLPASMSLLGKWALPGERTTFVGIFCASWYLGHCVGRALVLSFARWEPMYYLGTALTAFTAAVWWIAVRPWHGKLPDESDICLTDRRVPLVELVTAPRLLGTYLLAFASHGVSLMMDPFILYYLRNAHLSDIRDAMADALVVSVPLQVLGLVCPCFAAGLVSDRLVASGLLGRPAARRIHAAVGCVGVALSAIVIIAAKCDTELVVGCYTSSIFFNSVQRSLLWTVPVDAAPRLAGTLFALVHIVGCIGIKAKVSVVKWFLKACGLGDLRYWAALFFACALVVVILPVPYIVWGPFYEFHWAKLNPTPASIRLPKTYRFCSAFTLLAISFVIIVFLVIL